jgi:hypothetical protein
MSNWIPFSDKTPAYGDRFIYKGKDEQGLEYQVRTWTRTDVQCWQGWVGSYWLPVEIPEYPDSDERELRAWITKNRPSTHTNFDAHSRAAWYAALAYERSRK